MNGAKGALVVKELELGETARVPASTKTAQPDEEGPTEVPAASHSATKKDSDIKPEDFGAEFND